MWYLKNTFQRIKIMLKRSYAMPFLSENSRYKDKIIDYKKIWFS